MHLKDEWIQRDDVGSNPLLSLVLRGLRYYGLILYEGQSWKQVHNSRGLFFTACFLSFIVTQYVDLCQIWGDFDKMTENAATTLLYCVTMTWVLSFYRNRARFNKVVRLVDEGVQHILSFGTAHEKLILWTNVSYARRLTIMFWVCALVTTNGKCCFPLVQYFSVESWNDVPEVPRALRAWFPGGSRKEDFIPIYCIQVYIVYIGMLIIPCWHMFIVTLMVYVRARLMILNFKLAHLDEYEAVELSGGGMLGELNQPHNRNHTIRRGLINDCIQSQIELNDFVKELESLIEIGVFLDFVVFSVLLCTLLFAVSVADSTLVMLVNISYIQTMMTILFLYYWHANEIDHQYNLLSSSAFLNDWYNYPRSVNRHLLMFICYSGRSRTMKAFFVPMSLETFIGILRASYSYFTLLKQMAE